MSNSLAFSKDGISLFQQSNEMMWSSWILIAFSWEKNPLKVSPFVPNSFVLDCGLFPVSRMATLKPMLCLLSPAPHSPALHPLQGVETEAKRRISKWKAKIMQFNIFWKVALFPDRP
jgi:hypothetical protein